ncbi:hypothetical protein E1288_42280 [Saccharopolyspora elongata]|uniref:Uncharacterized protein n=1 Tax=Saccharopolyspora elongata TaxID=2530387 RepID=A0A4V2YIU4_9PSEU|nr:hypothetical protein E1288_42280 [Saccharopolyspora elongata]
MWCLRACNAKGSRATPNGGNIQLVSAPDRWPLWTSGVRPGPVAVEYAGIRLREDPSTATFPRFSGGLVPRPRPASYRLRLRIGGPYCHVSSSC